MVSVAMRSRTPWHASAKLIYLIPNFHCPTGRVLSLEKRHEVLRLAARARVPILESDVYGDVLR